MALALTFTFTDIVKPLLNHVIRLGSKKLLYFSGKKILANFVTFVQRPYEGQAQKFSYFFGKKDLLALAPENLYGM